MARYIHFLILMTLSLIYTIELHIRVEKVSERVVLSVTGRFSVITSKVSPNPLSVVLLVVVV